MMEYLPTRAFSIELRKIAAKNGIDGLIYRSSLTGKRNVCLFFDNSTSASILTLLSASKH